MLSEQRRKNVAKGMGKKKGIFSATGIFRSVSNRIPGQKQMELQTHRSLDSPPLSLLPFPLSPHFAFDLAIDAEATFIYLILVLIA